MASNTSTQTQVVREAPEIEALKLGLMKSAQALPMPDLPAYQIAGMSPGQENAINRGLAGIGAYQPYMDQASQGYTGAQQTLSGAMERFQPGQVSEFMSPYQQQVIDAAMANINRQGALARQNLQAQAVKSGAFGGSREGVQRAELQRGLSETQNSTIANMLNQGYQAAMQQAQQAFEAQQGRQMQGAQLGGQLAQGIGALGGLQQQLGQQDVTFQYGLGQQQQGQQQRELDALRATELQAAYQPYQQLGFISDIYKGAPSTQMAVSSQMTPTPSPFQQIAGLATGTLATAGAIKQAGGLF
jgi:hypothetical protein